MTAEEYIKAFSEGEKRKAIEKTGIERIHKHIYRVVILISDLNGGMIKLNEVVSVNQAVKLDNYEVSLTRLDSFVVDFLVEFICIWFWIH